MLFWFSQYIFVPYLIPYGTTLGASDLILGIMIGIYGLAQILIRIPLGILSDRLNNRKIFIIIGCGIGVFGTMGLYLVPSMWLVILMRFLTGISASCWVCFSVLYSSYFSPEESVRAQGYLTAFNYSGQTFGFIVAALISSKFGVRSTFLGAFFATLAAFVLSFMITEKKEIRKREALTFAQIFSVMKDKWLIIVSILALIFEIITFAVPLGFTSKLATQLGATNFEIALVTLVYTIPAIPAAFFTGPLGRRFGKRNAVVYSSAFMAFCCFLQPFCTSVLQLIIIQLFFGFARGVCYPMLMGLSIEKAPCEKRAATMGFFQAVYSIGILIGPIAAGAVSNLANLPTAFYFTGVIGLLSPVISLLFMRNDKKYPLAGSLK
ncbi:MAG: MFS transporter [Christensenellales bacterium]